MHILLTKVIDRIHNMLDPCLVLSQTTLSTPLVSLVERCTFLHVKVPLVEISIDVTTMLVLPLQLGDYILQFVHCPPSINWDIKKFESKYPEISQFITEKIRLSGDILV